jgi:hypothetical protein
MIEILNTIPHELQELLANKLRLDALTFLKPHHFANAYYGMYWDESSSQYTLEPPEEEDVEIAVPPMIPAMTQADIKYIEITWLPHPMPGENKMDLQGTYILIGCPLSLESGSQIEPGSIFKASQEQVVSSSPLADKQKEYWNKPSTLLLQIDYTPHTK